MLHRAKHPPFWELREQNCCLWLSSVEVCTGQRTASQRHFSSDGPRLLRSEPTTTPNYGVQLDGAAKQHRRWWQTLEKAALARTSLNGADFRCPGSETGGVSSSFLSLIADGSVHKLPVCTAWRLTRSLVTQMRLSCQRPIHGDGGASKQSLVPWLYFICAVLISVRILYRRVFRLLKVLLAMAGDLSLLCLSTQPGVTY